MDKYIKKEAALQVIDYAKQLTSEQIVRESGTYELLSDTGKACYDGIIAALAMCKRLIDEAVVVADVQPILHGRWIEVSPNHSRCSVCDTTCLIAVYPISKGANFCPNCGARMDAEPDEPWQSE